jgi:hypothetical protein
VGVLSLAGSAANHACATMRTSAIAKSVIVFLLGGICGRVVEHLLAARESRVAQKEKAAGKAPKREVRLIPVSSREAQAEPGECPICLQSFASGEPCVRLQCKHMYHKFCINKWVARGCSSCPLCRVDATCAKCE